MDLNVKPGYDPIELTEIVKRFVVKVDVDGFELRKYYRFRGGRWYGGIATGDVVGCNLRCGFCWSWRDASHNMVKGFFCTPRDVYQKLMEIANRRGYRLVRLSGGEPTISRRHLIELLKYFENTKYRFILETNGILIGFDKSYAEELSHFSNLIVRVSFKGTCEEEFQTLTLAKPEYYRLQFKALENLINVGFNPGEQVYPAVMLSFSSDENYVKFKERLSMIHPKLSEEIDEEYIILYPHVIEILRMRNLKPKIAYKPNGIPSFMI
ncbi:MAG: radical SAM protein [Candidatus Methanomethylicia archaeon]